MLHITSLIRYRPHIAFVVHWSFHQSSYSNPGAEVFTKRQASRGSLECFSITRPRLVRTICQFSIQKPPYEHTTILEETWQENGSFFSPVPVSCHPVILSQVNFLVPNTLFISRGKFIMHQTTIVCKRVSGFAYRRAKFSCLLVFIANHLPDGDHLWLWLKGNRYFWWLLGR